MHDVVVPRRVAPAAARGEARREEDSWRARGRLRSGAEFGREKAIAVAVDDLPAAPRPGRLDPAVLRDLQPRPPVRERPDVDLEALRFVRDVRDPAPVGRDRGGALTRRTLEPRAGRARPVHREKPDVGRPPPPQLAAVGLVRHRVEKVPAVRRPRVRELGVLAPRREPPDRSAAVGRPHHRLRVTRHDVREGDLSAVRRPHRRQEASRLRGQRRQDAALPVEDVELAGPENAFLQHDATALRRDARKVVLAWDEIEGVRPPGAVEENDGMHGLRDAAPFDEDERSVARDVEAGRAVRGANGEGLADGDRRPLDSQAGEIEPHREQRAAPDEDEPAGRNVAGERTSLHEDVALSGGRLDDRGLRARQVLEVFAANDRDEQPPAPRQRLRPEERVLAASRIEREEELERTAGRGDAVETAVARAGHDDGTVGHPGRPARDRRKIDDPARCPARHRHLLQLRPRDEAEPLAVGREERSPPTLRARNRLRVSARQRSPEETGSASVHRAEHGRRSIRRDRNHREVTGPEADSLRERQDRAHRRTRGRIPTRIGDPQTREDAEHSGGDGDDDAPCQRRARSRERAVARGGPSRLDLLDLEARVANVAEAAHRVLLQTAPEQAHEPRRNVRAERRPAGLRRQDGRHRVGDRLASERSPPREALVEDAAEGEDVGPFVDRLAARLLRRHVRRGPEDDARLRAARRERRGLRDLRRRGVALEGLGEAEVEQLDLSFRGDHDVRGLQVPVDDPPLVRRFKGFGDLPRAGESFFELKRAGRRLLLEALTFDELHDEEMAG